MNDPVTAPVLAALETHFGSRYGVRDDAAHLETYAADAFLVVGESGVRRRDVAPEAVLAAWALAGRDREPQFLAPSLVAWDWAGEAAGVAMVDLREAVTGTPLLAAVGMVRESADDASWRVEWATLIAEQSPLARQVAAGEKPKAGYDRQRLMALSELASLKAMSAEGPLTSLLEVAYTRRYRMPKARLLALPETRFSCQGTGACCRHELTIGLDDNSAAFLAAIDWAAFDPALGEGPFTEAMPPAAASLVSFKHRLAREADGRCRFLGEDNRCKVHSLAGRAVFKPCHVFPYRFTWTPDGICVTTHAMCPTARGACGLPLALQEPEIRSRLAVADIQKPERYCLRPLETISWDEFRTVEGQLLGLLTGEAPLRQKLWVALRWLDARLTKPEASVNPAWALEPLPRLGWLQRTAFTRYAKMFDPCFKDLRQVPAGEGLLPEVEAELERWFRSLLFSKVTTYPYGLVAGLNYLALVYLVLERQVAKHAPRGISEDFWREFYGVVTSGTFFRVLHVCHETSATRLAHHAASPAFGQLLLRV